MFSTDEFVAWSKKVTLFVHNTSHVDGEPHPRLLYEKGGVGWPTVVMLDDEGRTLDVVGHMTPVQQLENTYDKLMQWKELRSKAENSRDRAVAKELFMMELAMGNRPFAEMLKRRRNLMFSDNEQKLVEQQLINLQFQETLRATKDGGEADSGKTFVEMFRVGRIPDTKSTTMFWKYQFDYAARQRDVELFEELLTWLQANRKDDVRLRRYLRQLETQLEQLKRGE